MHIYGADADIIPSLEASALQALEGNYLGIFSRGSSFTYPVRDIVRRIKSASERIATVEVKRNNLHELAVSVTEKAPAALVCANLPDFSGNTISFSDLDTCYFADASGYIFMPAPSFSGQVYNRYYIPEISDMASSTRPVLGMRATSTAEFNALQSVYEQTSAAGINVAAILMKAGGEYELYAHNPTRQTSELAVIYFNNARPFSEELANLISFWDKVSVAARAGKEKPVFEYIDVRYGSNVFYRKVR